MILDDLDMKFLLVIVERKFWDLQMNAVLEVGTMEKREERGEWVRGEGGNKGGGKDEGRGGGGGG